MRIAFISRATLYTSPGGDTKQIDMTAQNLRLLGVTVDIFLSTDRIDYTRYSLLHFFNIIRPADILPHIRRSRKPYVVSTIFVDYGDFEKQVRGGLLGRLNTVFSEDGIEYIKAVARWIKNGERINSLRYLLRGHRRSVKEVAAGAQLLLPNSESEYRRFSEKYGAGINYRVVPNGISGELAAQSFLPDADYRDTIICAARIEERKNQLHLIRALNGTNYQLVIIGTASPNNAGYEALCRAEAKENVRFAGWMDEAALFRVYASARVHVLPSYFETTGLSSLEAAVMGCNIVVSPRGDTRDYFGDHAWYCEPESESSIRSAVDAAFDAPYDASFRQYILTNYTWKRAAQETLTAYQSILGQPQSD